MDRDFEIGGRKFKLSKIDVFKQFHVTRRIAPLLGEILPAMKNFSDFKQFDSLPEETKLQRIAEFAGPLMNGLSKLSDADSEFVLYALLGAVEVQQETKNWAYIAKGTMLMIQEFDLPVLLQIAGRSFMFNLSGFFGALHRQS